jgi:hypothetical protein
MKKTIKKSTSCGRKIVVYAHIIFIEKKNYSRYEIDAIQKEKYEK